MRATIRCYRIIQHDARLRMQQADGLLICHGSEKRAYTMSAVNSHVSAQFEASLSILYRIYYAAVMTIEAAARWA